MKIGILVESFPRVSETWLANQIIDLIERGNEVDIYSIYPSKDQIVHQQVKANKLIEKTQYFFYPKGNTKYRFWLTLKFVFTNLNKANPKRTIKGLKSILSRKIETLFGFNYIFLNGIQDLDILHAHFGEIGVFAAKMKRAGLIPKAKIVVSFHGHDIFPFKKETYQKEYQIFKDFSNALLVNSPYSKKLLKAIIPFQKIKLIPVGLDCSYFSSFNKNYREGISILFVGRLVFWKGPQLALEIFKSLSILRPDIQLNMIGDGDLKMKLLDEINKNNMGNQVRLLGALSQDEIIRYMDSSDIFLYPAKYETSSGAVDTQGLVIQEAQAMELPVICSDVGGIKYGMVDGETGFLVKEGDIDGFLEKIQLLIDQSDLREKMGKAGRAFVKKYFDSKVIGDQLESVYAEVLNEG
nr:glycosyltransferase [uncultured Algoriphagus sp.]